MIFRDNNGFKTCLVPGAINYYDKLSIIGSSTNVLFLSFCRLLVLVPMFYFPIFDGTNHLFGPKVRVIINGGLKKRPFDVLIDLISIKIPAHFF